MPYPYGGKQRQVQVDLNPAALESKGLSALDVVNAITVQNLILPTGTSKIGGKEYDVDIPNAAPQTITDLNRIPIKTIGDTTIYMKDVAWVRDGFPPQTNIVRVNGQRSVLLTIQKAGDASTLNVISGIKSILPRIAATVPSQLKMSPLADQSIFVKGAISGVVREALIAACLTAFMILMFLGNWRSTIIIATSIPLAILCSIITLSLIGQTINIMTLGGLALAVGILVDDATVEVENINRNREAEPDKNMDEVVLDSAMQIATPAFVSTLSICIVFAPMFLLSGVARYLFLPLAEAVVFAMLASYLLSRTIVPTMAKYLLRNDRSHERSGTSRNVFVRVQQRFEAAFDRMREGYRNLLERCLQHRRAFLVGFLRGVSWIASDHCSLARPGLLPQRRCRQLQTASCGPPQGCALKTLRFSATRSRTRFAGKSLIPKWPASSTTLACLTAASIFPTAIRPRWDSDADILVTLSPSITQRHEYVEQLRLSLAKTIPRRDLLPSYLPTW